jgi:death-on-curing protein
VSAVFKWVGRSALLLLHEQSLLEHGGLRGVRDEGSLESALARPQQILNYREDATLAELAAAYAVGIARNHPFNDGNKRAAFLAMGVFLDIHGYLLMAEHVEAYPMMMGVAAGDTQEEELAVWVDAHLQKKPSLRTIPG